MLIMGTYLSHSEVPQKYLFGRLIACHKHNWFKVSSSAKIVMAESLSRH